MDTGNIMDKLTEEERNWLLDFGCEPVLRIFLTSEHIKLCNQFVKRGWMTKGMSEHKNGTVIYYVDKYCYNKL